METYGLTAVDIANWFTCNIDREAGDSITHLKLQKLMYYAQAWSIALNGKSLFEEDFLAWSHGPVLISIYNTYKDYGFSALPPCDCDNNVTEEVEQVLMEVERIYGEKSAKHLERLTHTEEPWIRARGSLSAEERCNAIITKESMLSFYSQMLVN